MAFDSKVLDYVLFLPGFYVLIKSADLLVEGSVEVAKRLKVSNLIVGLTIVAFGTSAPELAVNIVSSIKGNTEIAISNILGSNIANIFLILGISSIIRELEVQENTTWKEIPFSLLGSLVIFFLANDVWFGANTTNSVSKNDGFILLSFFSIFLYYIYSIAKNGRVQKQELDFKLNIYKSILYIVLGLFGLVIGGDWIVKGAVQIALFFRLSESFIGLTIVAVGTSLPELATSAVAAYKKNSEIAIGNIVGSNIFNIFFILGISSIIQSLQFNWESQIDIFASLLASFLLFLFMFIGKRHKLEKNQGVIFLIIYFGYIFYRAIIGGQS